MKSGNKKAKKVVKRSIPKEVVPLDEQTWILQPVVVTTMRHDYDLTQTRALVTIIEKLEDSIKKIMDNVCSAEQLPLFTDQEFGEDEVGKDEIMLKISLKDFGSDKRRYGTLKEALKQLVSIPIETMATDERGKSYVHLSGLCEAYIEDKPYVNYVKIKLKRKIALRLLDTKTMGVHRYLKEVVFSTKNKYVQRFYMFISSWKRSGASPVVKVIELRKMLRLENKYPRWDMFFSKVIKGAMEELKEKAEAGETDCYFTVEPVYKNGKKRGEPESLRFTILQSKAGETASEIMMKKSQRIKMEEFLKGYLQQSRANINEIMSRVNVDNMNAFNTFMAELSKKVSQQGEKIKDLRAWAYTSCVRFLTEWEEANIVDAEVVEESPDTANATKAELSDLAYSPEDATKWEHFMAFLKSSLSDMAYQTWIVPMSLHSVKGECLVIGVPNRFFYEYIEEHFLNHLRAAKNQIYGESMNIMYVIR